MDNLVIYQHYDVLQTAHHEHISKCYLHSLKFHWSLRRNIDLKSDDLLRVSIDVFRSKYVSVFDTTRLLWRKNIKHLSTKWNELENKTEEEAEKSTYRVKPDTTCFRLIFDYLCSWNYLELVLEKSHKWQIKCFQVYSSRGFPSDHRNAIKNLF